MTDAALRIVWILSSALGAAVCGYTLYIAINLYLEHRRRKLNHGRDIITKGFLRRNIKRTVKMVAFFAIGIMAYYRLYAGLIILVLVLGNVADTIESILELRDDRRLERIYRKDIEEKKQEAVKHGFKRRADKQILEDEIGNAPDY